MAWFGAGGVDFRAAATFKNIIGEAVKSAVET